MIDKIKVIDAQIVNINFDVNVTLHLLKLGLTADKDDYFIP